MRKAAATPGRVLVVDDEAELRDLLARVLRDAGHAVETVETGESALQALARERFDVLVLDKNLPGINGLDVLRLVNGHHPGLRAIMMTGYPTEESSAVAARLGVTGYIVKPFGILSMVDAVDAAIAAGRAEAR